MNESDVPNLDAIEIVRRFFEEDDFMRYARRFVFDSCAPDEIRKYTADAELGALPIERLVCLGSFEENPAIIELLERAFDAWADAMYDCGWAFSRIFDYLDAVEEKLSARGSNDTILIQRISAEKHLAFIIKFLNQRFANPATVAKWRKVLSDTFDIPEIAKLFLYYALDMEINGVDNRRSAEEFQMNEELSRCLCEGGFVFMHKINLFDTGTSIADFLEISKFRLALGYFTEFIVNKEYYRDPAMRRNFFDLLKLNLLFGFSAELRKYLRQGDETLVKSAIAAWRELMTEKEPMVAGKPVKQGMLSARDFLSSIQEDDLACCRREWGEMKKTLRI